MSIEEYVKQSREEQRQKFGTVELKKDCAFLKQNANGSHSCSVCKPDRFHPSKQQCEMGV